MTKEELHIEIEEYIRCYGRQMIKIYLQDERELLKKKRIRNLISFLIPAIVASILTAISSRM